MRVIVVGCGVSGLSCGVRLLEAGYEVEIWARELPPQTTSNVAAAIWYPYKAYPVERVTAWGQRAFEVFVELAGVEGTGVSVATGYEVFRGEVGDPWWLSCVRSFRRATQGELPRGRRDGYVFETPVIEMSIYLEYLMGRFRELGGAIVVREVGTLEEASAESGVVVNCAGLGARELVGDESLFPIRGQIVRVEPLSTREFLLDEDEEHGDSVGTLEVEAGGEADVKDDLHGVTYVVPRSNDCVLGGTAQVGDWSLEPDMDTAQEIMERCARFVPEVREKRVLGHVVGLRPGRHAIRLEAEAMGDGRVVVHNYGHGGSGVTLSWGCAEDVVALVRTHAGS
ncbi:MAG: FAD-binding oxidoreductase [Chloroflexota bacterium]|nr:FAD-binding oxidoreductase [Chloroflexota bacterium]